MSPTEFASYPRLTVTEASERTGIRPRDLKKAIALGKGPPTDDYPGLLWIRLDDLKTWIIRTGREWQA